MSVTPEKLTEFDARYGARYYPDETEAEHAQPVDVHAGEERGGRDIRLSRQEGVTVSGGMVRSNNARILLYLDSTDHADYTLPVVLSGDSFTIAHVPPGTYTLRTWRYTLQPHIGDAMGDLTFTVGKADIRDLSLEIRPIQEQEIAGQVVFLGRTPPGPMTISLRRELGDAKSVVTNPDGSFVIKGILPGHHWLEGVVNVDQQANLHVVSEQLGRHDVMTNSQFDIGNGPVGPLKITVTTPVAKLTGKLLDSSGRPLSGGGIMLVSEDGVRSGTTAREDGSFTLDALAAGEQHVYVIANREENESFYDPDFLLLHRDDYAPVQIVEGTNAPLVIRQVVQ